MMLMPGELFRELVRELPLDENRKMLIDDHADTIKRRLESSFLIKKFIMIGSHSRGSANAEFSDVDYLAVLPRDEARWGTGTKSSTTFLNNVKLDLRERFKSSEIGKDGQAIVIQFSRGEPPIDIVPAIFEGINQFQRPSYLIADGRGGWIETSPEAHNNYIANADSR